MLLYKDFENIFRNPDIFNQFNTVKALYEARNIDEDANWRYKDARKKLKLMIDGAK